MTGTDCPPTESVNVMSITFAAEHESGNSDVGDYVAEMFLHIPSCEVLFSGSAVGATRTAVAKATTQKFSARRRIADVVESVNWSRR